MRWQDIAYRIFILGSALLFIAMIIDMLWDYQILAQAIPDQPPAALVEQLLPLRLQLGSWRHQLPFT